MWEGKQSIIPVTFIDQSSDKESGTKVLTDYSHKI